MLCKRYCFFHISQKSICLLNLSIQSIQSKLFATNFRCQILNGARQWCPGIINGNEQYLAHKRRQQKVNYLWPFRGMGDATLSFCQWHVKMGQVLLPIGTRWWNKQIEAVNCSLSRTFKLFPHTVSPSFTSTASALPLPTPASPSPRPWCQWAAAATHCSFSGACWIMEGSWRRRH